MCEKVLYEAAKKIQQSNNNLNEYLFIMAFWYPTPHTLEEAATLFQKVINHLHIKWTKNNENIWNRF